MPQLFYPWEGDPVPILQEARWASRLVWMGAENLAAIRIQFLNRPACSKLLYHLHYPSPHEIYTVIFKYVWTLTGLIAFKMYDVVYVTTHATSCERGTQEYVSCFVALGHTVVVWSVAGSGTRKNNLFEGQESQGFGNLVEVPLKLFAESGNLPRIGVTLRMKLRILQINNCLLFAAGLDSQLSSVLLKMLSYCM